MKKILVLGAGRVARPCVNYLLDQPDYQLTVTDLQIEHAQALAADHSRAEAVGLNADEDDLRPYVREHDAVICLLPARYLTTVAELCVEEATHMMGATYVSERMHKLHNEAENSDTLILTELGLDPGIDHMMAVQAAHELRGEGATIEGYRSLCGAIPSHEANDNPFGYKFSWSPEGALGAARRPARYLQDGQTVDIPGDETMQNGALAHVPGSGWYEFYPNGDATPYRTLYGMQDAAYLYRGTYRFPGWCETLAAMIQLGLLDEEPIGGADTRRSLTASLTATDGSPEAVAGYLGLPPYALVVQRIKWLGLLDSSPIPDGATSPREVTAQLMLDRLRYAPGEADMVVMTHEYDIRTANGNRERMVSSLIDLGEPGGDSAIARTTGLPIAIACDLLLRDKIDLRGVRIPVHPSIYEPSLAVLSDLGICGEERREPVH